MSKEQVNAVLMAVLGGVTVGAFIAYVGAVLMIAAKVAA